MPAAAQAIHSRAMTSCRTDGCAGLCTESGLAAAYAEHHRTLVARARRVVVDPHLAEDAAQEAFIRAWRACARFDPQRGPLRQWLLAITANVAKDYVKARLRRRTVVLDDASSLPDSDVVAIDRMMERAELVEALGILSEDHRKALVHTFLLGRPYAEVAVQLGVRPGTLRTRVHYALRRLRAELEPAC